MTKCADPQLWALSGSKTRRLSRLASIAEVDTGVLGVAIISSKSFYASGYPFLAEVPFARWMPCICRVKYVCVCIGACPNGRVPTAAPSTYIISARMQPVRSRAVTTCTARNDGRSCASLT